MADDQTGDAWMIEVMGRDNLNREEEEEMWTKQSIYKIPTFIKERNKNIYDPILVSIGPYHHGKPHLMAMEAHKRRALRHFIRRSMKPIEFYLKEMKKVERQLKESYEHLDFEWQDSNKFLEILITDGCFVLEIMDINSGTPKDYADNDPIFSYYGSIIHYNCIMRDLLLLENQLPYAALKKLLTIAEVRQEVPDENVDATLSQIMMFPRGVGPGDHMLDVYMKGLFQGRKESEDETNGIQVAPSASQLDGVGISFKKVGSFNDINFDKKAGTLYLPPLNINDYTISTFLNLKAFELRGTTGRDFNSYVHLMETLLQSVKDVKLLRSEGIIMNFYGSDEEVVRLTKDLAKDIVLDAQCASSLAQKDMNEYYQDSMMHCRNKFKRVVVEWFSFLRQNYFRNPWSAVSVVAAAVLLVLTVLQTIYTVKSYFKQGKSS